ncbi:MAG: 16S rRNA (cytosine(1402)-N(4))-methyltransferase RsmH [Acidipropionibacterium acidipropionici]|jgi:16S rRNA (cytosine1402-N4)-methyltransferase|uniref:Ribosomal RNA small subunit methyltransferase H n=1 Tax=Acidipropionibacterium acidipropionici (strain ATCC 4875 / DSM 20272 / JCM 6432 / NBRC 12425 / NCIMB 8070 / 4) TaxID=1171373 RepID=K7RMB0_ACIA4|nr:16S rRNA (cytosine(1402)-N(4))-methyltransferase RsmH [Acidipropionibacterium acidipropionici]AFV89099.1 S-adenosyl-methyltransferase MraW [Acidipropionibacterium acidipropionici ATCC 4875]ALN16327.1 ribosomal RNA small subunit methyltransferase H [Acidipropionibacterium acidipropionici]APZ07925.1 16S rRNA (cytosine(1402)-N(4))-methyltransferase [Acidipropionibacterium acidipropionici]QCV95366.1 16S rRNA (cytosine(1402)-N(4))-methyltransferase RsmH [Acidipropionibacterium acidipropionici]
MEQDDARRPSVGSDAVHLPVMRSRVVELLAPGLDHPGAVHVDGTLGMGGHAQAVLEACPQASLVGIDRDTEALELAARRLEPFGDRVRLVHAVHDELPEVLDDLGIDRVDSILLDLGLSSLQIDQADRGFAYAVDAPLDMRMDQGTGMTAAGLLNTAEEAELSRIIFRYGEDRNARRIARAIVEERARRPFEDSAQLVRVIEAAIPAAVRHRSHGHPAKKTFQALRIAVNGEMDTLAAVLPEALDRLAVGGRMAVLAYHSLEDRPVKEAFRTACSDSAPAGLPVVPESMAARFVAVTHGAERPDAEEVAVNPRSASARLRVVQRVKEAA